MEDTAAAEVTSHGSVALEGRAFDSDPEGLAEEFGLGMRSELEVGYRDDPWQARLSGFARLDPLDSTRDQVLLRDNFIGFGAGPLRLRAGTQRLTWSVTDAFYLADAMNSFDLKSDLRSPEKIGEPMVEIRYRFDQGNLTAYYMPARMEPGLPDAESRLSITPPGVTLADAEWVGRDGTLSDSAFEHQFAARATYTLGRSDIGVHFVQANDRYQPSFVPDDDRVRPIYHMMSQAGGTYVRVIGRAIIKVEGAYRFFDEPADETGLPPRPDHAQIAGGLEYTWLTDAGHEPTLMVEGQTILFANEQERRDLHLFQRDAFVGYRHAFNDPQAREITAFFVVDLERSYEYLASLSYSQRLGDLWDIEAGLHSFRRPPNGFHQAELILTRNF